MPVAELAVGVHKNRHAEPSKNIKGTKMETIERQ